MVDEAQKEALGPAERIIGAMQTHAGHMHHGRTGVVVRDNSPVGATWFPAVKRKEGDKTLIYREAKVGKRRQRTKLGMLWADDTVRDDNRRKLGEFRTPGIFTEAAVWMYKQAVEVWKVDSQFAAKWASWQYAQDHRDMKVVLAALMLVQSKKGDPVKEGDEVLFLDDDFRDVGEAMLLTYDKKSGINLDAKQLLRVRKVLELPEVAEINRELGFGRSLRRPFLGRWPKAVEKWLRYRERNPQLLEGLVKAGYRKTVINLARQVGYKPDSPQFFKTLRWRQDQTDDGRRSMAIGEAVAEAESWDDLSEEQICERIVADKPSIKVISGRLGATGLTRAVLLAAVEAGSFSDKDLIIYSPTFEDLGLLKIKVVKEKRDAALAKANDMRAANIASRMRSKEEREKLEEAADKAVAKEVEKVLNNLRVYFFVDISGSMEACLEIAKSHISRFLQGFPLDRTHVTAFHTVGREVRIRHASAAGVRNALDAFSAGGGTNYGAGVLAQCNNLPKDDEDVLFIFIGDEKARTFDHDVRASGLRPMAFGFIKVESHFGGYGRAVQDTAVQLGIPCFMVDERTFGEPGKDLDPYAIPRIVRNLVDSTPVGRTVATQLPRRESLLDKILKTDLLEKPLAFR